jgi:gas vesicle protein
MSQQDNFSGGFVLGAIVGGVVGGVLGVILANPKPQGTSDSTPTDEPKVARPRRRPLRGLGEPMNEQSMETARQELETKIAQLNDAIDDVRQQISSVNGRSAETNPEKFPS